MRPPNLRPACSSCASPERRRYPRYSVQVPIEIRVEGLSKFLCAETTDLSRNGCYLRLPNPLMVGLWVQATVWLDMVPIQVGGRVITRHPDFGNGIMFLRINDRDDKSPGRLSRSRHRRVGALSGVVQLFPRH